MKTLRKLSIFGISLICLTTSCKKMPVAYVETGKINGTTFIGAGPFNKDHKALGVVIDSCFIVPNAYKFNNTLYVFNGGIIPPKIIIKSQKKVLKAIENANWIKDSTYTIDNDAMVCKDGWIFYTRQKEDTIVRYKSRIFGQEIYRIKDELYKENYNLFVKYHNKLIDTTNNVNLLNALNISIDNYTINTGRFSLIFNSTTGYFDLRNSSVTKIGNFDKVKFLPKNPTNQKYLFRYLYYQHPREELDKYFIKEEIINEKLWIEYLRNIYIDFFPTFINGYNCTCLAKQSISPNRLLPVPPVDSYSPPLPLNANTAAPSSQ
jgi:hypothetical protein